MISELYQPIVIDEPEFCDSLAFLAAVYGARLMPVNNKGKIITISDVHYGSAIMTKNQIEEFYRKAIFVPVQIEESDDFRIILYAHRKTHKRVRKYIFIWKQLHIDVELRHRPWKKIKKDKGD